MRPFATHFRPRRAGLTLAELSVSLAVIATLMVAIGSVMVLTGRAVGMTAAQAGEARIDDVVTQIVSEARMSMTVPVRNETSLTLTVADRDGDGQPEKIQYLWAGPGQSLYRKVNNFKEVAVVANVKLLRFGSIAKTAPAPGGGPQVENSSDDLLYSHEAGSTFPHTMSVNAWAAQSLVPTLPPQATSWRVTEVQIHASRFSGSTTGKFWTVSICPTDPLTNGPNHLAPIEQKTLQMSALGTTANWSPVITFTSAHNLAVSQRYWVVVSQTAVTTTGSVSYNPSTGITADPYASTAIAGKWSLYPSRDMKIRVKGRYKYPAP